MCSLVTTAQLLSPGSATASTMNTTMGEEKHTATAEASATRPTRRARALFLVSARPGGSSPAAAGPSRDGEVAPATEPSRDLRPAGGGSGPTTPTSTKNDANVTAPAKATRPRTDLWSLLVPRINHAGRAHAHTCASPVVNHHRPCGRASAREPHVPILPATCGAFVLGLSISHSSIFSTSYTRIFFTVGSASKGCPSSSTSRQKASATSAPPRHRPDGPPPRHGAVGSRRSSAPSFAHAVAGRRTVCAVAGRSRSCGSFLVGGRR